MGALNRLANKSNKVISYDSIEQNREIVYVSRQEMLLTGPGSKGFCRKWYSKGKYIKLNTLGYEDYAEILSSYIVGRIFPSRLLQYYPCFIVENGVEIGKGCYSYSYLEEEEEEVTFGKILKSRFIDFSIPYDDLVDLLFEVTGIQFSGYICDTLFIDSIIKNDDRHFYNLSCIKTGSGFREAPIYDNGSSMLSDLISFPISAPIDACLSNCYSKPFGLHFEIPNNFYVKPDINWNDIASSIIFGSNEYFNRAAEVLRRGLEVL